MRNGLSLNDLLLLGSLHPTQTELLNTKGGEDTFSGNQEIWMRASFDLPNHCTPSNQQNLTSPAKNITSSETSFGLEPSIQNYYWPFNHLRSSKVSLLFKNAHTIINFGLNPVTIHYVGNLPGRQSCNLMWVGLQENHLVCLLSQDDSEYKRLGMYKRWQPY